MPIREKVKSIQWYVLACKGGYFANVFELFNNSPRRPRLAVVESLQKADIYPEDSLAKYQKLAKEVLGIESDPQPVRIERRKTPTGVEVAIILERRVAKND